MGRKPIEEHNLKIMMTLGLRQDYVWGGGWGGRLSFFLGQVSPKLISTHTFHRFIIQNKVAVRKCFNYGFPNVLDIYLLARKKITPKTMDFFDFELWSNHKLTKEIKMTKKQYLIIMINFTNSNLHILFFYSISHFHHHIAKGGP